MDESRREFLKAMIFSYFGLVICQSTDKILGKFIDRYWDSTKRGDEYELRMLKKLFGDFADDYRFIPGISHYKLPNVPHPDDMEAMATLERLGAEVSTKFELVSEVVGPKDHKGNLICLGSPMSNYVSKEIMGYRKISTDSSTGLERIQDHSPFEFRFEYIFDSAYLMKEGAITKRFVGNKEHVVPNWSIKDNKTGRILVPNTVGQNLTSDFLLISVLPNIFDRKAYDKRQKVVIFGGTHGVGTKSIEILFKDKTILKAIEQQLGEAPYWQSLITVSDTFDDQKTKRTAPRELSNEVICSSVHLRQNVLGTML